MTKIEKIELENGIYEGEVKGGVPHGKGIYKKDGEEYEGDWKNGMRHGNGMIKNWPWWNSEDPDERELFNSYNGGWKNNKFHGYGNSHALEGIESLGGDYDGKWKDGEKDGLFIFEYLELDSEKEHGVYKKKIFFIFKEGIKVFSIDPPTQSIDELKNLRSKYVDNIEYLLKDGMEYLLDDVTTLRNKLDDLKALGNITDELKAFSKKLIKK